MNIQKEITNVDTKDIKGEELKELNQSNDFSRELEQYNITDLENSRLTIKHDGKKYIFAIDGKDSFCVNGKTTFESIIKEFYEQGKTTETNLIVQTTALKLSIFNNTNTHEQQNTTIERPISVESLQNRIDSYKEFFKAQIDDVKWDAFWLSYNTAGKEKSGYKITKEVAKSQLRILENMEKRLAKLTKPGRYSSENEQIADYEINLTLPQFSQQLDGFAKSAPEFIKFQNDIVLEKSGITTFDLRGSINNVAGAKRVLDIITKFNNQEIKLTHTTLEIAKQEEYARDLKSLASYLQRVIADPTFDPSVLQFSPQHQAAINYLASDPTINTMLNNTGDTGKASTENGTVSGAEGINGNQDVVKPVYTSLNEAFSKGGINGMLDYGLDKTHMTDGMKENWKGAGNLLMTGGLIFVGWKFLSNAFKVFTESGRADLKAKGGWAWIVGPAALIFGANAWKGESPTSIINGGDTSNAIAERFGGLFGGKKNADAKTDASAPTAETYNTGLTGVQALFDGFTCPKVAELLEKDSTGKIKIQSAKYDLLLSTLEKDPNDAKKAAAAKFLKSMGKEDPNGILDIGLSSMGLSIEKLTDPSNEKVVFNEKAANATVRLGAFFNLMATKYNHINPEQRHLIEDYLKNDKATVSDLTDLENRGDVFEKSEEFPPDAKRQEFKDKIDKFTISATEKETLKNSLNSFWHLWSTDEAQKNKLDITQEGGSVVLNTYGQKTKFDLLNKTIPGFVDKDKKLINFSSTVELLKAANLTNRIFDLISTPQNKTNISKDPFNVSLLGRDVEYDNTKFWSGVTDKYNHKDITVVSGGIGGALQDISPALESNKDGFINLLNTRFNTVNKLDKLK